MAKVAKERAASGNGGWVRWERSNFPGVVWVRFRDDAGRLVPIELYMAGDQQQLTSSELRNVPLGRLEAWVNGPDLANQVRARLEQPGPDLRRAAAHYATTFGGASGEHWVKAMLDAQRAGSGVPQAPAPKGKRLQAGEPPHPEVGRLLEKADAGRRNHGDEFYRKVASVYADLHRLTNAPALAIAEANAVAASTARRWVKEARKRGFLPPGRPGKAG